MGSSLDGSSTYSFLIILIAIAFLIPGVSAQQTHDDPLEVGERAPDFEIPSTLPGLSGRNIVQISALLEQGQTVVLAFFPRAFTGG